MKTRRWLQAGVIFGLLVVSSCSGGTDPPVASFSVAVESGSAPLTVQFRDTSVGSVDSWAWDFGDGATSSESEPVHVYTEKGVFSVTLRVENAGGVDESVLADAIVIDAGPLSAVVVGDDPMVGVTESETLEPRAVDEFGNTVDEVEYAWEISDPVGTIDQDGTFTAGTQAGVYADLVRVTAMKDDEAVTASIDVTIEPGRAVQVAIEPPTATVPVLTDARFEVVGVDEFGNDVSAVPASWTTTQPAGEVDGDGVFTAGTTAGSFPGGVVADTGEAGVVVADVVVVPGVPDVVDVQPADTRVAMGESVMFVATVFDAYRNEIPGLVSSWTSDGVPFEGGVFTGAVPGSFEVTALVDDGTTEITGDASVSVLPWYPDFGSVDGLSLVGTASQVDGAIRLTPALSELQAGAVWTESALPVSDSFDSTFSFRLSGVPPGLGDGDGLAFVIQASGNRALGAAASGIGYKDLSRSVAIEIDTTYQGYESDSPLAHISVHTLGTEPNTTHHGASLGSMLTGNGRLVPGPVVTDGAIHTMRVSYRPGRLSVFLDDLEVPLMSVSLDISDELGTGDAWIGFTAATENGFTGNHDLLSWSHTATDDATTQEPPTPAAAQQFAGEWVGVDVDGSEIALAVDCCAGGRRSVMYSDTSVECEGGPYSATGVGRLNGEVLNVNYEPVPCVGLGQTMISYFPQPDGTLISTDKVIFTRR
jgi:PKD repeat protein